MRGVPAVIKRWQKYWLEKGQAAYRERKRKAASYDLIASLPADCDLTHYESGLWGVKDWCGTTYEPQTTPEDAVQIYKEMTE